jgi:hypothetical protein
VGLVVVLIAVAVGLFVVLSDDDGDDGDGGSTTTASTTTNAEPAPPTEPAAEVVEMRDGAPVGGVRTLTYEKGDEVLIVVKLDEPQEDVHIHGYDIEKLNPSGKVSFDFPAKLDGIYELEAHGPSGDVLLAEIRVSP